MTKHIKQQWAAVPIPRLPATGLEGAWASAMADFDRIIKEQTDLLDEGWSEALGARSGSSRLPAEVSGLEAWLPEVSPPTNVIAPATRAAMSAALKTCNARNDAVHLVPVPITPRQRAAVSAHWSVELRAKVAAKSAADKERERCVVTIDGEEW